MKMAGAERLSLPRIKARLKGTIKKKTDASSYIMAALSLWPEPEVTPSLRHDKGPLSGVASANCFIVLPRGTLIAEKDTFVECEIFNHLTL
jgi:molybdopterin biosynthesis enzyme